MSTPITPPSSTPSFNVVSYDTPAHSQIPNLHSDPVSSSTSHASSPESHPVDLRSPILEVEEEDETSSEAANEPVTPTDNHHPHIFHDRMNGAEKPNHALSHHHTQALAALNSQPRPLVLNTTTTSPPPPASNQETSPVTEQQLKTPTQKRPGLSSKDSKLTRGVTGGIVGLFRRSNSHGASHDVVPVANGDGATMTNGGSETLVGRETRRLSIRRMSANNSPYTTRSNTPPSPGLGGDSLKPKPHLHVQEPTKDDLFHNSKNNRSSTGLSLGLGFRDRFNKHKNVPSIQAKEAKREPPRHRSTSVDLNNSIPSSSADAQLPQRAVWALPAETGIGLKSRRMSLSLPDDFTVDVADLYAEFSDQSKMVGRRGKSIGKGATSKVKLMHRKGCPGEVYAVKEFRGKSSVETAEDYEQKVKSEYSIAKSVHHPNIVETIRLCTHSSKWNHVMEYCDQGDLFSLVSLKYLSTPERQADRLCLFKQLIQGINYLHCNGIAHRDIKLENLLITKDSKLKITDFGVSEVFAGIHPGLRAAGGQCGKEMKEVRLCAPGMCGSPPYVAPEVLEKKGEYDPRPLDVWGAAIVMLCLCANGCLWDEARDGSSPLYDELSRGWRKWNDKHADGSALSITETDYPHVMFFDRHINPPALRRVLLTMLNPDPAKRASIASIAKNRWLKNVDCCQVDSYDDPSKVIDASRIQSSSKLTKVVVHNHLPPTQHIGHKIVRLPGSTDMF